MTFICRWPDRPWLAGFDPALASSVAELPILDFLECANQRAAMQRQCTGHGQPVRFVPQTSAFTAADYERGIAQTGEIPTRDNLHDRYNALVWLTFPETKAWLNRQQVAAMGRGAASQGRGRQRDALTIWDENLAVLVLPPGEAAAIRQYFARHEWQEIFLTRRGYWQQDWQVHLFGHALLEKLAAPFKAITAHLIVLARPEGGDTNQQHRAAIDRALVPHLQALTDPAVFLHLPVMGIPGWDPANHDPTFYSDAAVFRPQRTPERGKRGGVSAVV